MTKDKETIYDVIIIGGGAAGLFAGASLPKEKTALILEKSKSPGKKLLMSGASQCNLTHGGSIKDFLVHYGENGGKIRSILYSYNNLKVIDFFESKGIKCLVRNDGKVFPKSLKALDILNVLLETCKKNEIEIICKSAVKEIIYHDKQDLKNYEVICDDMSYNAKNLIVATGGSSYPTTGSDGSFFEVLKSMGVEIVFPTPALVPVKVHNYPYSELSGISFENIQISLFQKTANESIQNSQLQNGTNENIQNSLFQKTTNAKIDDLLFTHNSFSGPVILNASRYVKSGDKISINYLPKLNINEFLTILKKQIQGNNKQISTFLCGVLNNQLPKRFIEILLTRLHIDFTAKASSLTVENLKAFLSLLTEDKFTVSGLGGFNMAMVTKGGIDLDQVDFKTLSLKKYPSLHLAGEVLDIDGDTGGYNLQFAFSSGYFTAMQI